MADETKTRVETVTENIEAIEEMRGAEAYPQITVQCLKDISISLAMLVDAGASGSTTAE